MLRFLLFLTLVTCIIRVSAQHTLPPYKHYTLRDGLSQMQVISMFQDSRGYLWIGTKSGLNCFNGEKIVSYTSKKSPEIDNDHIRQICEDSSGNIWANTITGIFRVDGKNLKFFKIDDSHIDWMAPDSYGRIWFSKVHSSDFTVSIHCIDNDSIRTIPVRIPPGNKAIPHVEIKYDFEDDLLLLAVDNLLYCVKNGKSEIIYTNNSLVHFLPQSKKVFFCESCSLKKDSEDIYNFDLKQFRTGRIETVAKIRNGRLTESSELNDTLHYFCITLPDSSFLLTNKNIDYDAFENIYVSSIVKNSDENYWIGSENGFYQLFGNAFSTYKQEFLPQIWSTIEDKEGSMWFSSYLFGLYKYEKEKFRRCTGTDVNNNYQFYFHPAIDKRGRLFFPHSFGMLMVEDNRFKQKTEQMYLTTFYDAEKDLIWGGCGNGAAAFNSKLEKVRVVDENSNLDVGRYVLTIGKDSAGCYWMGGGAGLARYNWQSNTLKNYKPGNTKTGVYTQRNDYTGRTWFGSKDGLFWYDAKADSLCKIESDELKDAVNLLENVDSTWLIVSQPYGIYLFDLQAYYKNGEVRLHLFNEKNGFLGIEPGQDGAYTDSKGNIWMTTSTEIVKLDPRKLTPGKTMLNVRIDKCNGKKLPFNADDIQLSQNQNSVVLTFEAICFNRPNAVEYSWKLEQDSIWSDWQVEDYAVIENLPDGNSKLLLKARVPGLPDVLASTDFVINTRLAIWKQKWFFPALFVVFALFSLLAFVLFLNARNRMVASVRQSKMFQVQAIQSQMNPHFIFNILASFQTMILSLQVEKANQYLVKLAQLIRGFLDASTGSADLQKETVAAKTQTLKKELELISGFVEFQQLIYPDKFDFIIESDKQIDLETETIPPMILQPFVENAIRHGLLQKSGKGTLKIILKRVNIKGLQITIKDDGVGIEKAGKLLTDSPYRYHSKGTLLTFNRAKLLKELGYQININTFSSGEGTKILITIENHEPGI